MNNKRQILHTFYDLMDDIYYITIVVLWAYWKRWVCDVLVMYVQSYDIVRQSNDSRTMTYDMTMIAEWVGES